MLAGMYCLVSLAASSCIHPWSQLVMGSDTWQDACAKHAGHRPCCSREVCCVISFAVCVCVCVRGMLGVILGHMASDCHLHLSAHKHTVLIGHGSHM